MSASSLLQSASLFSSTATIHYENACVEIDDAFGQTLEPEVRKITGLPEEVINRIALSREGAIFVNTNVFLTPPGVYASIKRVFEDHLFAQGEKLYTTEVQLQQGKNLSTFMRFWQQKVVPFSDFWGATRNGVALVIGILKLMTLVGVITLSSHAFAILLLVYASFILIQGLLALSCHCPGALCDGALKGQLAETLEDKRNLTTAELKKWAGRMSLVEGLLWISVAIADFTGLLSVSSILIKVLFWGVFNITFFYSGLIAYREYQWHKKFTQAIEDQMGQDRSNYRAALLYIRAKWHMHLKPEHAALNKESLIKKAGRKLHRLEQQTNQDRLLSMKTIDALMLRLDAGEAKAENEAKLFVEQVLQENKKKIIRDAVSIILNVIGLIFWFDNFVFWAGYEIVGTIFDCILWVAINLAFLFCLDHEGSFQKFASSFIISAVQEA